MAGLPAVSGAKVVKALERAGFAVARVSGSHHVLRHPDGRVVVVPVHPGQDIAKGTLRSLLKLAGMTPDDLRNLL
ncbi:MAG: type II toxin-antitoxin system HicA family toxin [Actinomycetota bacterium]|nr:type II toxin-antitoxin system HicA family toxin [Actinomycetota bacterium]